MEGEQDMERYTKEQLKGLLTAGSVHIITDQGEADVQQMTEKGPGRYLLDTPFAQFTVSVFEKGRDTVYRTVAFTCKTDLTLYRIDFLTVFPGIYAEFIEYKSFINAPAAAFVRYDDIGFYTGVENPFFQASAEETQVCISYEPSLILKAGETYESEPQFLGCYVCTGEYVTEKAPINIEAIQTGISRSRFFNPCGEIGLDLAEIDAMRRYVTEYYDVIRKRFDNILYFFFYPKKQLPETREEVQDYLSSIDRFCEMSGDIVAFNPHYKTVIPTEEKPYWELAPKGSAAEEILTYAQKKGLRCGYYMGCAFNGEGGNAALLPYMPDKKAWKKKDAFGNAASENCLGCDEYLDWWYTVQKNTIEKYDLGYWSWDPGPGNGNDCYADNHGHIPGKGEYKGWRNSQKLLARLKEEFPELFLMSFYGRKEYGIWGFRYFSQHEVYWEQAVLFGATLHNDLHDDRINAHGTRLQNQWSMNFRFLPAHLGHGLVPRMGESWFDPEMDKAYDFGGWKYALLSAIACCGSVTHCTLPDHLENMPDFTAFYQKWIRWAKDNYRFCEYTKPISDRVSNEVIDGFSRICKDKGQIFLFNSSPKVMNKKLVLDEKLGLDTENTFFLKILYYEGMGINEAERQYRGAYQVNDVLDITLPPFGCVILELNDQESKRVDEIPRRLHTIDVFYDQNGQKFHYPVHEAAENVELTAQVFLTKELERVLAQSHIAGETFLQEKITAWHEEGMPFTFASALPSRLVMYLPFEGPVQPKDVKLFINETEVPVEVFCLHKTPVSRYAFVEKYVKWGCENQIRLCIRGLPKNSFLGIHVDYPDCCEGMHGEEVIFSERSSQIGLYPDPTLLIDAFTINPSVLPEKDGEITVTVKTDVDPERIENIYFLHPTLPQMPALGYDPVRKIWQGVYPTGNRAFNIFSNKTISAWIKAKDGGIGPKAECKIEVCYTDACR